MAQVILQHLKNFRSKISGNNYVSLSRVLNATTPKDTVLPLTKVGALLNKNPELQVVHAFWRGSFRHQQRLDLGKCWTAVLLLSDKIKGPCFLYKSLHSLDSTSGICNCINNIYITFAIRTNNTYNTIEYSKSKKNTVAFPTTNCKKSFVKEILQSIKKVIDRYGHSMTKHDKSGLS